MKVTPLNVARFWRDLMFPPHREDYHIDRANLKVDLPWEPWLHCGVWIAVLYALIHGDWPAVPPINGVDWVWVSFGLTSPTVGFTSVWMLKYQTGKPRYIAIWLRMIADVGLSVAILAYLITRLASGMLWVSGVLGDTILLFAAWFTLTLVSRDMRLIIATERLATKIHEGRWELPIPYWTEDPADDGS